MPRKGYRAEEIIAKLREADVLLGRGKKVAEVAKALGVSEVTYYRWRQEYGGMSVPQARRLKELERENARLRERRQALRGARALERAARRLGMVKAGERPYVISHLPKGP